MFVCLVVFNATFNNSSAISWKSVLLMEETGGPGENHRGKNQLCVWSSIKDQRCAYLVLKEKRVGCPIEYLTIQTFELEQKSTSLHLSKIRYLPKIVRQKKRIFLPIPQNYLTYQNRHPNIKLFWWHFFSNIWPFHVSI